MAETAETPAELSTEPSYAEGPQGGPGVTIPSTEGPGSVETTQSPGPGAVQPTEGPSTGGPQTGGGGVISDAPISPIG